MTPAWVGSTTSVGSSCACTTRRIRLNASNSGVDAARYCSVRSSGEFQSSMVMVVPSALNQSICEALGVRSPMRPNRTGRSAGFSVRSCSSRRTVARMPGSRSSSRHESHVSSESWQ